VTEINIVYNLKVLFSIMGPKEVLQCVKILYLHLHGDFPWGNPQDCVFKICTFYAISSATIFQNRKERKDCFVLVRLGFAK
jgi:hypothetical protein